MSPYSAVTRAAPVGGLVVRPLGSGQDDGPRIAAALVAAVALGTYVRLVGGIYTVNTPTTVPSFSRIEGVGEATVLESTLTTSGAGGYTASVFIAAPVVGAFSTTLSSGAAGGSLTISTAAAPTVGMWLELYGSATNVGQYAQVRAVTGSGPYTVTLDRALVYPLVFTSGASVRQVTPPIGITIRNMVISGTGDRAIEIGGAQWCLLENIVVDPRYGSFSVIVMSFDIGSAYSVMRNVYVDGGGVSAAGPALESNYRSRFDQVRVVGCSTGLYIVDSTDCDLVGCSSDNCSVGILLGSDSGTLTVAGCNRIRVIGGAFNTSSTAGAQVWSPGIDFVSTLFANNLTGIQVYFGGSQSAPGGPCKLNGVRGQSNSGPLLSVLGGDVIAVGLSSRDDGTTHVGSFSAYAAVEVGSASNVTLVGGTLTLSSATAWYGIYTTNAATGRVALSGGLRIEMPTYVSGPAIYGVVVQGTGVVSFGDVFILNGYAGIYTYSGSTVRYGSTLSIVGANSANSIGGTASSWGTIGTL